MVTPNAWSTISVSAVTSCSVTSSTVSAEPVISSKAASTTVLENLP